MASLKALRRVAVFPAARRVAWAAPTVAIDFALRALAGIHSGRHSTTWPAGSVGSSLSNSRLRARSSATGEIGDAGNTATEARADQDAVQRGLRDYQTVAQLLAGQVS